MSDSPVKSWSAWLPVGMSMAALALVITHIAIFGTAREPDEGAAAHIWQLLMAGQAVAILFYLFRWASRYPAQALGMVAVQICAALAGMAPVYYWHL